MTESVPETSGTFELRELLQFKTEKTRREAEGGASDSASALVAGHVSNNRKERGGGGRPGL